MVMGVPKGEGDEVMLALRRLLGSGIIACAVMFGLLASSGAGAPPAPTCNVGDLQLRSSTVNQGLGSYDRLVRGKETLVRLFLSLPQCATSSGQSIQITGGTLRVSGGGATASGIPATPTTVSVYPPVATYLTASLTDAPGDLKFVVPGTALAPAGTVASFNASFHADLTYQYKTSNNATPIAAAKGFDLPVKTVEKKTNALRVLVVPMGNAAQPYSSQFPASAVAAVENGMQTLSRIFPVPSGVGTLGGCSGGIRYAIDPTLLNVPTPYCGDGGNFDAIKAQLAQFLVSWNTANPTAQADRVVGAISSDPLISSGSSSGCAEGMASVTSPEAWVRAFPDSSSAPSMTGALFAMEIGHTLGLVPPTRSATFHSLSTPADGTDPNRGYNVSLRAFLADDHSTMKLAGAWNNNTTIFEKADYAFLLCVLGGATNPECTTPTVAGTVSGVAALASAYALTGHTDGITPLGTLPPGTVAQESYVASELEGRGTDSSSIYKLVQRAANNSILQTTGVRVAFGETIHEDPSDPDHEGSELGTFSVVAGLNASAQKFELWKGTPGSGLLLWSALKTNPPVITPGSFTVTPGGARNFTNTTFVSEEQPSLTADASWVAYGSGYGISIAPVARPQSAVSIPLPTGLRAHGQILYSELGVLKAVDSDGTDGQTIFNGATSGIGGASDPEWSPDSNRVVFSAADGSGNRDIYVVNSNGSGLRRLTTDAAFDTKPTWSAKGQIIFVRGPQGGGPTTELYSVRPDGTGETRLTDNGVVDDAPAVSPDGNQIAWETAGGISKMNIDGSGATSVFAGNGFNPDWSPTGTRIAFDANLLPFETTDIYMVNADGTGQIMVTDTVGPDQYEFGPKWSGNEEQMVVEVGNQGPGPRGLALVTVPSGGSIPTQPQLIGSVTGNGPDWAWLPAEPPSGAAWGTSTGDGAKLAFVFRKSLYTLDVDLSQAAPRFIGDPVLHYSGSDIEGPGPAVHPTWSRDESSIAFTEGEGQFSDLLVLDLSNDEVTAITDDEGARHPSWSRGEDTNDIAYEKFDGGGIPEIWTINPADAEPSPTLLLSGGSQPSWAADGRLAFGRDGDIWTWTPGIDPIEEKIFDNGKDPSLAGNTFAFTRLGNFSGEFGVDDIFIGSPGSGVNVNVEVTDDNAADNRLDLLVDCPGLTYVGAVALLPTDVQGASASWAANFDPSLTCENPSLRVAISDGYNRVLSGQTGEEVEAEQKGPTAAIYTPPLGSTFREYDVVPARGSGWDAEDGTLPDANLDWKLEHKLLDDTYELIDDGEGPVVDFSPLANGFPLGDYRLTLTVVDSLGNDDSAERFFTIVEDADNDGLTATEEAQGCVTNDPAFVEPPGYLPDQDPLNSFRDGDLDGIPNIDDPAACTAASVYEAIVDVDAEMVKSQPLGVITGFVKLRYRPITAVIGSTVRISSINDIPANIPSLRWSIDKNGVGISKFDKAAVIAFLNDHDIPNGLVLITITGCSTANCAPPPTGWRFEGSDVTNVH